MVVIYYLSGKIFTFTLSNRFLFSSVNRVSASGATRIFSRWCQQVACIQFCPSIFLFLKVNDYRTLNARYLLYFTILSYSNSPTVTYPNTLLITYWRSGALFLIDGERMSYKYFDTYHIYFEYLSNVEILRHIKKVIIHFNITDFKLQSRIVFIFS